MIPLRIHSENAEFQQLEALKTNRTKRNQQGRFFVEGVRNINLAVANGWTFKAFVSAASGKLSDWAKALISQGLAEVHYVLTPSLMEKLSDKHETSELLAIVAMPTDELSRLPVGPKTSYVVLDRPSNPGNLGTVLRSCDAFGIDGVIVTGHAVDPYDPKVIRSSMGSFFARPLVRIPSQNELLPWIEELRHNPPGLRIIGTSANADHSIRDEHFGQRCLFVFGNETTGLSAGYREFCDAIVRLPMGGSASSLNVSCAVSIALYEHYCARAERMG